MAAAMIGIVEQDGVRGLEVLAPVLDRDRRPRQRADVNRKMVGLRDQARIGVANRQREVAAGIQDLRIGGAKHGFARLLDDRPHPKLGDRTRDGMGLGGLLVVAQSAATSVSAPDAASMTAWISWSVIGVDNAINP